MFRNSRRNQHFKGIFILLIATSVTVYSLLFSTHNSTRQRFDLSSLPTINYDTPKAEAETLTGPATILLMEAPSQEDFTWPIKGVISSYMGPSHPMGIDIDFIFPVKAAKSGTVTFAGGNPCCSYGNYVILDHGRGVQTLYAHLAQFSVVEGDVVPQGFIIGTAGSTGYATGVHLHFEVIVNGMNVNPLDLLPANDYCEYIGINPKNCASAPSK